MTKLMVHTPQVKNREVVAILVAILVYAKKVGFLDVSKCQIFRSLRC